jgi:hypothetical protein
MQTHGELIPELCLLNNRKHYLTIWHYNMPSLITAVSSLNIIFAISLGHSFLWHNSQNFNTHPGTFLTDKQMTVYRDAACICSTACINCGMFSCCSSTLEVMVPIPHPRTTAPDSTSLMTSTRSLFYPKMQSKRILYNFCIMKMAKQHATLEYV